MTVLLPTSVEEALAALREPDAQLLAGGTDFVVELNAGRRQLSTVVALDRIAELRGWRRSADTVWLGAGITYTEMLEPSLAELVPALAQAARTVGSPQIRNAGTLGGNLGTASPAGDTLPVLAALEAIVEVYGPHGGRDVPLADFVIGPKRNALGPGELIVGVRVPVLRGHQEFRKVGVRNAMVIAVASLALAVDEPGRSIRCALGAVGPVPIRATEAEAWLAGRADWQRRVTPPAGELHEFGDLVARASRAIDDHRGTADYRTYAVGVLARRAGAQLFATWTAP